MPIVSSALSLIRTYSSISKLNEPIGNVAMNLRSLTTITRGTTAYWQTNFYDPNNNLVQPSSANINVVYQDINGNPTTTSVAMTLGVSSAPWTAELDTRNIGTGPVYWSIFTPGPIPVSVEDGVFDLVANPANQLSF
jgi:hypothetical protein